MKFINIRELSTGTSLMNIHLHANATTKPRHSIQASTQSVTQLANELGVSEDTIRRCLRRHGVADLKVLLPKEEDAQTPVKTFKVYEPGFVHVDINYLPQMPDQDQRTYLFAAIDRAIRWVYMESSRQQRCPVQFSADVIF